jgi:hypothetical protein
MGAILLRRENYAITDKIGQRDFGAIIVEGKYGRFLTRCADMLDEPPQRHAFEPDFAIVPRRRGFDGCHLQRFELPDREVASDSSIDLAVDRENHGILGGGNDHGEDQRADCSRSQAKALHESLHLHSTI